MSVRPFPFPRNTRLILVPFWDDCGTVIDIQRLENCSPIIDLGSWVNLSVDRYRGRNRDLYPVCIVNLHLLD